MLLLQYCEAYLETSRGEYDTSDTVTGLFSTFRQRRMSLKVKDTVRIFIAIHKEHALACFTES